MKKLVGLSLGLYFVCSLAAAFAQESSGKVTPPPKVLVIMREFLKPGRQGSTHEKSESAFVRAMNDAKWPTRYFAADALSGRPRSLFFVRYDSFEAWEKDNMAMMRNPTLFAAMDQASLADGDLLTDYDTNIVTYREDLSLRAAVDIAHMRYFEISRFVVRPGHYQEWEALAKEYKAALEKADPTAHWAMFESMYGADNGGVFVIITPLKSLTETDRSLADSKTVMAGIGEQEMKKLEGMEASCIESFQTNLFMFNPRMSYPPDEWVKADPDFWSSKMTTANADVNDAKEIETAR
ncbi:MAG TPA: hypothetical protein VHT24_07340 [Pseudacidobacterium sp.]|nr:hypothetical protein [Pseudacidobacterium sp.]